MAAVVKSGVFADEENALWRREFLKQYAVLAMISLPGDLFYPTAVDTTILIAQKRRQSEDDDVFMGKIWNDGYKKLKGKRVETSGSQLEEILGAFQNFREGKPPASPLATVIKAGRLMETGAEFCPEQYLPQPEFPLEEQEKYRRQIVKSILTASVSIEDLADEVIKQFPSFPALSAAPLPYGEEKPLEEFFHIHAGKSGGEGSYGAGSCPYVSSGDSQNSIIRLVNGAEKEVFPHGAITVTCFGQAYIQPWRFMARGNGGSAVRILIPKYAMTFSELAYFAAQINMQRWRFFYGRMAIQKRLKNMLIRAPLRKMEDNRMPIAEMVHLLSGKITELMGDI